MPFSPNLSEIGIYNVADNYRLHNACSTEDICIHSFIKKLKHSEFLINLNNY